VFTTFPHVFDTELKDAIARDPNVVRTWFAWTPYLDAATLVLAREGIAEMRLGQRGTTDYLSIVLSQIDTISHYYGPLSLETMDALMVLDRELEYFLIYLDEVIGPKGYVLALSADHGFCEVPEHRQETGRPGRRIAAAEIESLFVRVDSVIAEHPSDPDAVAGFVTHSPFVAEAYTPDVLAAGSGDDFLRLYRNSWRRDRVPRLPLFSLETFETPVGRAGVMLRLTPGSLIDLDTTNHGSPYDYDRHVPLIFYGAGVASGVSDAAARTIDVAPTLAALARIPATAVPDGRVLFRWQR